MNANITSETTAAVGGKTAATGTSGGATTDTGKPPIAETTGARGTTYLLVPGPENLTKYVNSRVEIHGMLEESAANTSPGTATGAATSGASTGAAGASQSKAGQSGKEAAPDMPKLRVATVRVVPGPCPEQR